MNDLPKPLTRAKAIEAKCRDCIYDENEPGNWRKQCDACTATECPLWEFRPRTRGRKLA